MIKLNVVIPTYEMNDMGHIFLEHSFEHLVNQTYRNFNIIISDHSSNNKISDLCIKWSDRLDIKYIRKTYLTNNPSSNLNNCIRFCDGDYIKILFMDDFLSNDEALMNTIKCINDNPNSKWFASMCAHTDDGINYYRNYTPLWNDRMVYGVNTISSPSVITLKNDSDILLFNEDYIWLMDCEYYQRCYDKFGLFTTIPEITIINRINDNRLSATLSDHHKNNEINKLTKIYAES